jgi:predicted Zn-dependent protease
MTTIQVKHGSLTVNMPVALFIKGKATLKKDSDRYFAMLMQRYPWLSANSIAVFKKRAEEEMQRIIDEMKRGAVMARELFSSGKEMDAIKHLESYLIEFPEDPDAWYALGEILSKMGRTEEGYKAMNHGRRMFSGKGR